MIARKEFSVQAAIVSDDGQETPVEMTRVETLKDVKGIRTKSDLEQIAGREDEYAGYYQEIQLKDYKLERGDYVFRVSIMDTSGELVEKEEEKFTISGDKKSGGSNTEPWDDKVHSGLGYAYYFAPIVDSVKIGGTIQVQGFILIPEGYKATSLLIELVPMEGDNRTPIGISKNRGKLEVNGNLREYPQAAEYQENIKQTMGGSAGGSFRVSTTVPKKSFTKDGYAPGRYLLRVTLQYQDPEGNVSQQLSQEKEIQITEK